MWKKPKSCVRGRGGRFTRVLPPELVSDLPVKELSIEEILKSSKIIRKGKNKLVILPDHPQGADDLVFLINRLFF